MGDKKTLSPAPIVSIVPHGVAKALDGIMSAALESGASDIHLEKKEASRFSATRVRLRIDGLMRETEFSVSHHDGLIARLKILARLRTDIHTLPQDGRFSFKRNDGVFADIRLSIVPTYCGEKAVMRLLAKPAGRRNLSDLGFTDADQTLLMRAVSKPDGLILVTGPTGSGKTTTLYELLELVSEKNVSVVSLEDPVEYSLPRVTQIPVHHRHNFTFSTALRSILRQDPDVVMVGEIRDTETAELAASAALTGHLVLSTLHTMDAARTITRLLNMGVSGFVLAPSLSVIVSQRLVRKICKSCQKSASIPEWCLKSVELKVGHKVDFDCEIRGAGCESCAHSGYRGRAVIYEMIIVDDAIAEIVRENASHEKLKSHLSNSGWRDMLWCGIDTVKAGMTNFEELFRVLQI